MINFLVGNATVVLKDVVVGGASRVNDLLENRQNLSEVFIRDIGELCSVVLGNDKLYRVSKLMTLAASNVRRGLC
jgi:hypothetical protein